MARASLSFDPNDWQARQRLLVASSSAAINSFLMAGTEAERLRALGALGQALAARDQWRGAIRALRAALAVQEDASVRALYDQWLAEHGFRITGHRVDADAANPRICVDVSDPLPRDRAGLADFLQIETGRGLTVEVDPQALCVDGVVHGERYRLRVRAGLPAADGETLASSADLDIYVRDRSPSVRFQGRAYVLPKGGEAAIPLVSINTRLVKAQVLRLGDRSLASAAWEGGPPLTSCRSILTARNGRDIPIEHSVLPLENADGEVENLVFSFRESAESEDGKRDWFSHAANLRMTAAVCRSSQDYALAEVYYRRALAFLEEHLGADNPKLASILEDLAEVYRYQEKQKDAEILALRVARLAAGRKSRGNRPGQQLVPRR